MFRGTTLAFVKDWAVKEWPWYMFRRTTLACVKIWIKPLLKSGLSKYGLGICSEEQPWRVLKPVYENIALVYVQRNNLVGC